MTSRIPYVDLAAQFRDDESDLLPIIADVLRSGDYIGGHIVENLEKSIAQYCGASFCKALNSGTDALLLALMAIGVGEGDEVITQSNSFVASAAAIVEAGATPVFADVCADQSIDPESIRSKITSKTKAIIPVHLTGRISDFDEIQRLADEYGLYLIEDAAQAFGSAYRGRRAGSLGHIAAFSAHPLKNLNACGDAGFVVTDNQEWDQFISLRRNHGLVDRETVALVGTVSRMDVLQAAILQYRLSKVDDVIAKRRRHASIYFDAIDPTVARLPLQKQGVFDSYHTFVIQVERRDELKNFLASRGIGTAIHYPVPIHMQKPYSRYIADFDCLPETQHQAGRILTLPIHQNLSSDEVREISCLINSFYGR